MFYVEQSRRTNQLYLKPLINFNMKTPQNKSQMFGIARIRFTSPKLQTVWSLPVLYTDIVQLKRAVMDAPNVPVGTECDFQYLGSYDGKTARIIPAPRKTFILKGVRKSSDDNLPRHSSNRAAEATESVGSKPANVSVAGDCD